MYNKAVLKYFWDINMSNILISLLFTFIAGMFWGIAIFSSVGILLGYLIHKMFKDNEYYAYYNLGFTKANLLKKVWSLNLIISALVFLIYLIIR